MVVVAWGYRWLLFRIMRGAGLIKIRGDACWRDLTCMDYHYQVFVPFSFWLFPDAKFTLFGLCEATLVLGLSMILNGIFSSVPMVRIPAGTKGLFFSLRMSDGK